MREGIDFGFLRVKVIALAVQDLERANHFYGQTLGLPPAYEGEEQVGYLVGETIFMLKANWYAAPTEAPNPRITLATKSANSRTAVAAGFMAFDTLSLRGPLTQGRLSHRTH